jgi:hypothetical protein
MAKLARDVFLRDPNKHRDLHFATGEEPAPEYAALITNPDCWEDGVLPDIDLPAEPDEQTPEPDPVPEPEPVPEPTTESTPEPTAEEKPARKTTARKPAAQ